MIPQNVIDALVLMLEEGFKKSDTSSVREVVSLLEAQRHDCTDIKTKLSALVLNTKLFIDISFSTPLPPFDVTYKVGLFLLNMWIDVAFN